MRRIKKVAVMGSGVMGSAIAAHFTNAGIPCLLLDVPAPEGDPNTLVQKGLENAKRAKPPAFYSKNGFALIETGNFSSDLGKISGCDLIIEAVVEKMDIKQALWKKVDALRAPGTLAASNTSGLSINGMVAGCSADLKKHFLGMHFFNPPRYLKLLEIIPGKETDPGVVDFVRDFGENVLGKGIVICRDTPNFIANRVGAYWVSAVMKAAIDGGYSVQETDALTGANIGHPKSATFRTADVIGLDTLVHVTETLFRDLKGDDEKEIFKTPEVMEFLVKSGSLGSKTGKGFYQKNKSGDIDHLDFKTRTYTPKQSLKLKCVEAARAEESAAGKVRAMVNAGDRGSELLWKTISATFLYCAKRIGEICDTLVEIDNALKWGWGHQLGAFEKIDALGAVSVLERIKKEGRALPKIIEDFLAGGNSSFYKREKGRDFFYDFRTKNYQPVVRSEKIILLKNLKDQDKVVVSNAGATLLDLGDGVAGLEFHTKMNALGPEIVTLANQALDEVERRFDALVIGNQHDRAFSAGANLMLMLMAIQEEEWDDLDLFIRNFQNMNMRFRYSPKPVVVAMQGLALGGGCEVCLHADHVVAAAESYMGLVEAGAGLIPAGGGTKEMLLRAMGGVPDSAVKLPFLQGIFETLAKGKVSGSAPEAMEMGFLKPSDAVILNGDFVLHFAKQAALGLARSGYYQKPQRSDIPVLGREGYAALKVVVAGMQEGKFITEHDAVVALKLGWVLTGGNVSGREIVSEQYLLDLEREAFLSLCGMRKTQERIKSLLDTGKPLRN